MAHKTKGTQVACDKARILQLESQLEEFAQLLQDLGYPYWNEADNRYKRGTNEWAWYAKSGMDA